MTQIVHNDNRETQEQADLAAALVKGVSAEPDQQAALWMLLEQGPEVWAHPDLHHHYVPVGFRASGVLSVNWQTLAHGTTYLRTLTKDARAAVQMACSLADTRVLCYLAGNVTDMTPVNRDRFIEMMRRAGREGQS